ncbi:MAG: hypothetical protein U1U88_001056 [Lawsonella clevelandensis]
MNTRSTASCYLERAIYVVVFIGLILCLVGCGRQSVYSEGISASTAAAGVPVQSDPDRIHANHDHGADRTLEFMASSLNKSITTIEL